MNFIKHEIEKGDTLESLARQYEVTAKQLVEFHNLHSPVTQQIYGDKLPIHIQTVITPSHYTSENKNNTINFKEKARYRCEQINISKINDQTITLSSSVNTEYLISFSPEQDLLEIDLKDYVFSVDPKVYHDAFSFSEKIERLKSPVLFEIGEEKIVNNILNRDKLEHKWKHFCENVLKTDSLYQQIAKNAPEQARDVIITGNKEFSSSENLSNMLDKNLFFHVFLRAIKGKNLNDYYIEQYSQLFPSLLLHIDVVKTTVSEDENFVTYRLVGTLDRNNISEVELQKMYDEIYKPIIKYNYTEFNYTYRIIYTIDKNTGLLSEGKVALSEKIKNNFEAITELIIRKVNL
ncbi:LysM peptidoglycan-binding domain-containing protein [Chryseobacterium sp. CT-SW4]|uniref:LysM peptidoglycan-binding domain-containing protein n=1 Tax=Chryseobacterium sp. SW-1 TaxID=3157343 RepID=UPI003B01B271